jgi:hypothetical protein
MFFLKGRQALRKFEDRFLTIVENSEVLGVQ